MTDRQEGRAFVFGDRIDTDLLAPGSLMKLSPEALAAHCLAALDPTFAERVRPGDFVVAGEGFGIGSSREQAAQSLQILGVRAVLAKSFARIFYRNAYNLGLPAVILPPEAVIAEGDMLRLDLLGGELSNLSSGRVFRISPVPERLLRMIEAGGLMAQLAQKSGRGSVPGNVLAERLRASDPTKSSSDFVDDALGAARAAKGE